MAALEFGSGHAAYLLNYFLMIQISEVFNGFPNTAEKGGRNYRVLSRISAGTNKQYMRYKVELTTEGRL